MGFGYEVGIGFGGFELLFKMVFLFVAGGFIITAVRGISTWNQNNNSPRLTVAAKIMSKRTHVSHNGYNSVSSTRYYVTFQVDSGDRMELSVTGTEYGMLAEGDLGKLTFQGTRYVSFERS